MLIYKIKIGLLIPDLRYLITIPDNPRYLNPFFLLWVLNIGIGKFGILPFYILEIKLFGILPGYIYYYYYCNIEYLKPSLEVNKTPEPRVI